MNAAPARRRAANARCAIALLGVCLAAFAPRASADRAADLERLRGAIETSRERVATYEREARDLLETVEALDRSAAVLAREVVRARQRAERTRAELREIESEAKDVAARLRATEAAMKRRAIALYKAGELGMVPVLFSADGLREFLARISALRLFLGRDASLLERHRAQSAALLALEARTREAAREAEQAASMLREREQELAAERRAKRQLIARLHADRTRERAALVELERARRALEETLAHLREAPRDSQRELAGPPFESLRQKLESPVDAPIARGFGRVIDEEFLTETFRKGVEYDARLGSPVRAVADARVRFAGWFRGYGRLVILDHGDQYFTVSGHLSELAVEVGDRVARGQKIGAVGDTGSLSGPQLYFEIRRGREPLDPAEWLRSEESG